MTRIILAGATGLTGSQLVPMLARDGHELHIIGRRAIAALPEGIIQHFQDPSEWPSVVRKVGAEAAISCLGTTIKQAGSKEAFRGVDFDLVTGFAHAARQGGAGQFIAVSSVGASAGSSNFYLKTKGETEQAIGALGFERVDFLRPGLLRGDRTGPSRPGESIAAMLSPVTDLLMIGGLDRYRSISAQTVAKAIASLAGQPASGRFIHENREIETLAG
jgi:uncharacterized protein YbjT (DUF2867 family)